MLTGWELYLKIYVVLTLVYLWYRFILLFLMELRPSRIKDAVPYNQELISVLLPFYNEDVTLLKKAILSLIRADGNKEIIVVDDGSTTTACADMVREKFGSFVKFVRFEQNRGKRHAQKAGFAHVTGQFLVTMDSDTVITKDALLKLIQPLLDDVEVGATTGNVRVFNVKHNLLTRMISARYWNAFNVERKSLSGFGIVTCCSGVLSAYRAQLFAKYLEPYVNQRFWGQACSYGDDRHLTNLVLKDKFRIQYVEEALCYTLAPTALPQFFRQQLRWKKSFLRESLITLRFAFRHSALLPVEVLLNLVIPFWSVAVRVSALVAMILYPVLIPTFIGSVLTVALIRNFFLFIENKRLAIYSLPYAFVHEFGLFWLYLVALFTLREESWGTR